MSPWFLDGYESSRWQPCCSAVLQEQPDQTEGSRGSRVQGVQGVLHLLSTKDRFDSELERELEQVKNEQLWTWIYWTKLEATSIKCKHANTICQYKGTEHALWIRPMKTIYFISGSPATKRFHLGVMEDSDTFVLEMPNRSRNFVLVELWMILT